MLRVLIGTGLLLMMVGFGAAGWQFWSSLPETAAGQEGTAPPLDPSLSQVGWLVSPTGGLIPRADMRGYLAQDRFVPGRIATVTHTAPLTALLGDGETLPAQAFLQVFADIRAPRVAEGLCPVLLSGIAQDCALHSARVVPDSVDPVRGTARFRIELAYRLKPDAEPLPDFATHVFRSDTPSIGPVAGASASDEAVEDAPAEATEAAPVPTAATAADALAEVIAAGVAACAAEDDQLACRIMALSLDWAPATPTSGQVRIGWLAPLPDGMFPAPSLDPAPEAPRG